MAERQSLRSLGELKRGRIWKECIKAQKKLLVIVYQAKSFKWVIVEVAFHKPTEH